VTRPPLPSLREVTRQLRVLHEVWSHPDCGGEYVAMTLNHYRYGNHEPRNWIVRIVGDPDNTQYGREFIPGDGAKFDAVAAARRLLAAARDAESTEAS
jgi:hypothetical protein